MKKYTPINYKVNRGVFFREWEGLIEAKQTDVDGITIRYGNTGISGVYVNIEVLSIRNDLL